MNTARDVYVVYVPDHNDAPLAILFLIEVRLDYCWLFFHFLLLLPPLFDPSIYNLSPPDFCNFTSSSSFLSSLGTMILRAECLLGNNVVLRMRCGAARAHRCHWQCQTSHLTATRAVETKAAARGEKYWGCSLRAPSKMASRYASCQRRRARVLDNIFLFPRHSATGRVPGVVPWIRSGKSSN